MRPLRSAPMIAWSPSSDDPPAPAGHPRLLSTRSVSEMPATRLPIIGYPLSQTPHEGVLRAALAAVGAPIVIERWERRPHQLADALREVPRARTSPARSSRRRTRRRLPHSPTRSSDDARISGAVNVFVRDEGRLRGHNTDADGIRAGLEAVLPRVKGKWPRNAVVLGAGGGARAVVAVLIGSGFQHVAVLNRHLHKAEALVAHFARSARHMELRARPWHDAIIEAELARAELLINASGIGVKEGESPIPTELLPADRYVLDLVLTPGPTPLMDAAREREERWRTARARSWPRQRRRQAADRRRAADGRVRAALATELGVPEEGLAVVGD